MEKVRLGGGSNIDKKGMRWNSYTPDGWYTGWVGMSRFLIRAVVDVASLYRRSLHPSGGEKWRCLGY